MLPSSSAKYGVCIPKLMTLRTARKQGETTVQQVVSTPCSTVSCIPPTISELLTASPDQRSWVQAEVGGARAWHVADTPKCLLDEWVNISPEMLLRVSASLGTNQKGPREVSFCPKHNKRETDECCISKLTTYTLAWGSCWSVNQTTPDSLD